MLSVDFGSPLEMWQWLAGVAVGLLLVSMLFNRRFAYAVGQHLSDAITGCWSLFHKALHPSSKVAKKMESTNEDGKPDEGAVDHGAASEVFMLLTRLIGGTITAACVGGIIYIDVLRIGPTLFPGVEMGAPLTLPVPLGTLLGCLTAALGILLGTFLAEVLGGEHVPESVQFLPPWWMASRQFYSRTAKTAMGLYALYLVLVSLVGQAQSLGLTFDGQDVVTLLAGTLLLILAVMSTVLAHYLIFLGMSAAFALVCALIGLVLILLRLVLSPLIPQREPVARRPAVPEPAVAIGSGKWAKGGGGFGLVVPGELEKKKRKAPAYQGSLIGVGEFGLRFLPIMLAIRGGIHPKGSLRLVGFCPTGRYPDRSLHELIRKIGARDIGITPDEVAAVRRTGGV